MRIINNNIKVLCIFCCTGILNFIIILLLIMYSESSNAFILTSIGMIISIIISIIAFICNFIIHFYLGKKYLYSTRNVFIDLSSYLLIFLLMVICLYRVFFPIQVLFSAGMFLGGFIQAYNGTSYYYTNIFCIYCTSILSIVMQMLGMSSKA